MTSQCKQCREHSSQLVNYSNITNHISQIDLFQMKTPYHNVSTVYTFPLVKLHYAVYDAHYMAKFTSLVFKDHYMLRCAHTKLHVHR